jgi:ATP-dependent DNA ligase
MPRIVKRSASQAIKPGPSRRSQPNSPLPLFVPPQLSKLVEKPPSGPQWAHEIKLDGFRMAARIDNGRVQLLTRTRRRPSHEAQPQRGYKVVDCDLPFRQCT